jgi:flagellar hook-length control protein FliK
VNALDMLGGFTASAGPIGGTEASSAGDAGATAGGAFESLVARALQGSGSNVEPDLTDASDEDRDPAESGLDLSILIAMAGLTPFQVTAPPVVDNAVAAGAAEAPAVEVVGAAGSAAVSMTLDELPCTLTPAGGSVNAATDAPEPVGEAEAVAGDEAATAEPIAAKAARTTVPVDLVQTAAPSTSPAPAATAEPAPGRATKPGADVAANPAGSATPSEAPAPVPAKSDAPAAVAPTVPSASAPHPTVHASLAKPTRVARNDAMDGDGARQQATAELLRAIDIATGTDAPAKTTTTAATPVAHVVTARPAETGQVSGKDARQKDAVEAIVPETAVAVSGGVSAATQTMGQSGQFGQRSDTRGDEAGVRTAAPVTLTGVRAEAAVQAFTNLAAESAGAGAGLTETMPTAGLDAAASVVSPEEGAANVHAMVRAMRMQVTNGGGEARLQLNPEHLGQVTLTVKVEQGRVAAHIQAETADASRWIETHQSNLRSALEEQGLEVKELLVSTDPDGRREREQSQPQQKARTARRPDGEAPKFEILV